MALFGKMGLLNREKFCPRILSQTGILSKIAKNPEKSFVPNGRVIKYPKKCAPGAPAGPPRGAPGAPGSCPRARRSLSRTRAGLRPPGTRSTPLRGWSSGLRPPGAKPLGTPSSGCDGSSVLDSAAIGQRIRDPHPHRLIPLRQLATSSRPGRRVAASLATRRLPSADPPRPAPALRHSRVRRSCVAGGPGPPGVPPGGPPQERGRGDSPPPGV